MPHTARPPHKRTRLASALIGAGIVLAAGTTAGGVAYIATKQQTNQQHNGPAIDDARNSLRILVDCTTPGHACYERGRQQTAGAVDELRQVVILAVYCQHAGSPTVAAIESCVRKNLPAK